MNAKRRLLAAATAMALALGAMVTGAGTAQAAACIPSQGCVPHEDGVGAWWADSVKRGKCTGQSDNDWLVFYKTDNSWWRRGKIDNIRFGAASWSKVDWPVIGSGSAQAEDVVPPGITLCFGGKRYSENDVKGTYVRLKG
jgi:hypothetical protein